MVMPNNLNPASKLLERAAVEPNTARRATVRGAATGRERCARSFRNATGTFRRDSMAPVAAMAARTKKSAIII